MTGGLYGDDTNYGLTKDQRRKNIKKNLLFGFFELFLVCISVVLIINFAPNNIRLLPELMSKSFQAKVLVWIIVYGTLYMIFFLRRIVIIFQWIFVADPRYK